MSKARHPARNAEIVRRRKAGEWPTEIAKALGLSRNVVIGALNRAGLCSPDVDRSACGKLFVPRGEASVLARLSNAAVRDIRENWKKGSRTAGLRHFAQKYGVHYITVYNAAHGNTWDHVQ